MPSRPIKQRWQDGEITLGQWAMMPSASAMEVSARANFDFICIDLQHGLADYGSMLSLLRTIDLGPSAPFVRVPWNEPGVIGRSLDAGASGIIVPMINSVEEARAAVSFCRYPPAGSRSFGPLRVSMRDGPEYYAHANENVVLAVMIETRAALDAVADIAALDGVDLLFVGPFDLSVSLGLSPGDNDGEPAFDKAIEAVLQACRDAGKPAGVLSNTALVKRRAEQGFSMISVTMDVSALSNGINRDLAFARDALADVQTSRGQKL